jgi:ABC-type glucose/galactose transport system permease subunit
MHTKHQVLMLTQGNLILEKPVLVSIENKTDLLGVSSVRGACRYGSVHQIVVQCK